MEICIPHLNCATRSRRYWRTLKQMIVVSLWLLMLAGKHRPFYLIRKDLRLFAWLKPGSSDPLTIERLIKRGAKVYRSESMHMKVYWSSRRGCVIGSANASGNALGGGIQKEVGVWLPPNVVDIQRLWDYAKPKLMNPKVDLKRLTLEGERAPPYYPNLIREQPPNFLEWRTSSGGRRDWKLGSWDVESGFAKEAVAKARQTYGV
jgi:hypothetical protein